MRTRSLFPLENDPQPTVISGLSLRPEYITAEVEQELAALVDEEPWDTSWDRRRQPYGHTYGKSGAPQRAVPAWGLALIKRLQQEGISERPFNQMLVNEYFPGQGIALHRDYEPFDHIVASLSLLAPCVMDFRRVADDHRESLLLERRSLLVLRDVARYDWEHGIARRKNDRWQGQTIPRARRLSITFRRANNSA
jgi:alkylated DNA repair dioxygenase AlkB